MRSLKILMYHAVGEPGERATRFVVPLTEFEKQMAWLARGRFAVVRLQAAVSAMLAGNALPRRAIAITFDDGTRDNRTLALPVLQRYGFPATAFIVTHAMGSSVRWTDYAGLAGRPVMTWSDALELEPLISLEPHTRTHPSLPSLDDEALTKELRGSRDDVEQRVGRSPVVFAYPYGHYDARVAAAVADAGFLAACTVQPGVNSKSTPPYELRRYEVRGDESLTRFARTIVVPELRRRLRRSYVTALSKLSR
jgi:peptidoglycan/xylan/chitin deacetylase (PgdA/CDA1 family)